MSKKLLFISVMVVALAAMFAVVPIALADQVACEDQVNNTFNKLLDCVTVEGVHEHQAAFQTIADAHNGIRTSGTPGYDASVDYVVQRMTAAGYNVSVQDFQYQTFITLSPTVLEQISPLPLDRS